MKILKLTKILGDNLTGRRTLISKIINDDKDPYRGHGLSYEYINITGKDEEECGCLSFITVDPSAPIRAQECVCTPFMDNSYRINSVTTQNPKSTGDTICGSENATMKRLSIGFAIRYRDNTRWEGVS